MPRPRGILASVSSRAFVGLAVALLLVLCGLVAYLAKTQWDWLGRIEVYEHMRIESTLGRGAYYFKSAFDNELESLAACFDVPGGRPEELAQQLAGGLTSWRASSRWPDLLGEVYLVSRSPHGLALEGFDPAGGIFPALSWEPELEGLRQAVDGRLLDRERGNNAVAAAALDLVPSLPAVLIETRRLAPSGDLAPVWVVLRIDREFVRTDFLPELTALIFAPPGHHEVDVAVVETASGALLYSNLPITSMKDFGRSDVAFGLVDAGTDGSELPRVGLRPAPGQEALPNWTRLPTATDHAWFRRFWARDYYSGYWQLFLRQGKASVADRVASNRWRTLRISFGALALVSVSALLIFLLARRAERLAAEQMEFVATVSHELRSPLAILSAAGENLEDALPANAERLREYGRLIRGEALRLTEMVENVLHLARDRSGAAPPVRRPLDLVELTRETLLRARPQIERAGFAVELELPAGPFVVRGHARALQSALLNLLSNAIKYGLPERWLKVEVGPSPENPSEVFVAVEDRGPGLEKAERGRLFEPFFRGRKARGEQVEGSGLGLAVVRQVAAAHGGRVEAVSRAAGGSRFTLTLPKAEAS